MQSHINNDAELATVPKGLTTLKMVSPRKEQQRSKTMKGLSATKRAEVGTPVKIVLAQDLANRVNEVHEMIARYAYELFAGRGGEHGRDLEDWLQAESDLLHVCRHDLRESAEAVILHADLPCSFTADQLKVCVNPLHLIVSGETELDVICGGHEPAHTEKRTRRILRMHDLPAVVDPSKTTATLKGETLEIVMPKVMAEQQSEKRTRGASSGR
jgi:HSP20 family molecular chaperone IbpA